MQIKLRGRREKNKLIIVMSIPTEKEKEVITMEMPDNGDWSADMECYDKVLSAYEERLDKAMQLAQLQQTEEEEQSEQV